MQKKLSYTARLVFFVLVGTHFVATCFLARVYYELIRVGAANRSILVFDVLGCISLYVAAALIARGNLRAHRLLLPAALALGMAAKTWSWLPGWWLVPALGAALAIGGRWIFADRNFRNDYLG